MNKQQCCLVQGVHMHGNLGATQLLRNTLWSETTNEDSTSLRVTHASLNVTHGGKKKTMQHRVMNCVCGDTLRRIEHATRHPILPCKSMHSLDVTPTNITFTRSSQTTDLFTNVNTTNTDSFTHKTTNKTNKNPLSRKTRQTKTFARANHVTDSALGIQNGTDSPRKQQILTRTGRTNAVTFNTWSEK